MTTGWQGRRRDRATDPLTLLTTDARWTDEWGTGWEHAIGGSGASPVSAPLADWADLDGWLEASLPDPCAPGRLDGALPALRALAPTRWTAATTHQGGLGALQPVAGHGIGVRGHGLREPDVERRWTPSPSTGSS
ncbi:MAG: hypothetical protein U0869_03870 [Chloroflexota bacterium]